MKGGEDMRIETLALIKLNNLAYIVQLGRSYNKDEISNISNSYSLDENVLNAALTLIETGISLDLISIDINNISKKINSRNSFFDLYIDLLHSWHFSERKDTFSYALLITLTPLFKHGFDITKYKER